MTDSRSRSAVETCSSVWWMVALTGPSSTTSAPVGAIKRPSEVPPEGGMRRFAPGDRFHAARLHLDEFPPCGLERQAAQPPVDFILEPMARQHLFDALSDLPLGYFRRIAQIEFDLRLAGNDVGRAGAAVDIGHLKGGRLKIIISPVPFNRQQFGDDFGPRGGSGCRSDRRCAPACP